jgi:hypothetical protein
MEWAGLRISLLPTLLLTRKNLAYVELAPPSRNAVLPERGHHFLIPGLSWICHGESHPDQKHHGNTAIVNQLISRCLFSLPLDKNETGAGRNRLVDANRSANLFLN